MLQILTCNLQPANYTLRVFMLVHNVLVTRAPRNTLIPVGQQLQGNHSINHFPGTDKYPLQSSQYDAFPSQAQDQCFTRLAKMRRNTVTN